MRYARGMIVAAATAAGVAGVLALNPSSPHATAQGAGNPEPGGVSENSVGTEAPEASPEQSPEPEPEADQEPEASPEQEQSAEPEASPAQASATYTGDAYPTKWGSIQVAATVTDGALTDISFVSLPLDSRSVRINEWAAPALVEEALAAQSAAVDTISGATWTSEGFRYSLQSILEQAGL